MRVFVDTNVFVYLFDRDAPEKSRVAQDILQRQQRDLELVISTQVLQEFYVAVTRKLARPVPADVAERAVRDLSRLSVVAATTDLVMDAISLSGRESFSFWDAMIVEAAHRASVEQLLSEDMQDGRVIGSLTIHNPFLPDN